MPLNSVQIAVQGILNNLPIPGSSVPLKAFITPPTMQTLSGPIACVWGGRMRGRREAGPRGPGFKHLQWVVDVYLSYETNANSPGLDQQFPLVVDAVMNATWTTSIQGTFITDPTTNVRSQILAIGEDFELEMAPVKTPGTLRMLYYAARLGLDVYEAVQG